MTEPVFEITDAPAKASSGQRIVDRIRERTQASLEAETATFPVPARPGFEVAFSVFLAREVWDALVTAHGGNQDNFGKAVLRHQCRRIVVDGEVWLGGDGSPVTFGSPDVREALGAVDDFDAIKKLYIRDPDVVRLVAGVVRVCGWDLRRPVDPTQLPDGSSSES